MARLLFYRITPAHRASNAGAYISSAPPQPLAIAARKERQRLQRFLRGLALANIRRKQARGREWWTT